MKKTLPKELMKKLETVYTKDELKTIEIECKTIDFKIHNNLRCLTGDQFINHDAIISKLNIEYDGDIVEMEAYSILSIARNYNLLDNTMVIKGISDGANNEAIDAHMSNLEVAMKNSIRVLDDVLLQIK